MNYTTKSYLGYKEYELTNHLGNVLSSVSDKKIAIDDNADNKIDYYVADQVSATDYYAFGQQMYGRRFNNGSYRYGFNGQERDDEIAGVGNVNTAMFWEYDTRLGRRWNIDPVYKYWESPYSCFSANPIANIDLLGNTDYYSNKGKYIGSDGVDNGVKLMTLSKKTSKEVKTELNSKQRIMMEGRDIINVPSVAEVGAMRTAWTKTERGVSADKKSGHEEGFVSGGGVITESQSGKPATLPVVAELPELTKALEEHNNTKGAPTNLIVHTHPDLIDGTKVSQGTPSEADFKNARAVVVTLEREVTFATIGTQKTINQENGGVDNSPVNVTFYDARKTKGSIELKQLEKTVKKIDTHKK